VTGRDPYCVFNQLDDDFMPLEGGGGALPPPDLDKHQSILYAFGAYSMERREALAGVKKPTRKRQPKQRPVPGGG
jgi:hypothetical protein